MWTREDLLSGIECEGEGEEVKVSGGRGIWEDVGLYELVEVSNKGLGRTKSGKGSVREATSVTE